MDPYHLKKTPIDASRLFEKKQKIQEPYIIRSDKIIYTIGRKVSIEDLVPDNWVEYLRKELKDTNSITAPSKKTIDIISEIIRVNDYNVDKKEFIGYFLKWGLELNDKSVRLIVIDDWGDNKDNKKKHLNILPSFYPNEKILSYIVKFLKMMISLRLLILV
ncbi:hypothetical protein C2G38_2091497 [Gigaspora rosea]|uniref:Uncharacterized protein n=1 Tax=Gigaspora rosea TaxID=44941 RepID=A0A397V8C1_9GLOM|nr:hypothetical protein C2G38_2091497 [Gigaspora rosea]